MSSASQKPVEKPYLILQFTTLLAVTFLVLMAIVLAYLGGVMTGRGYWHDHPEIHGETAVPQGDERSAAKDEAAVPAEDTSAQKILAPEELRFSRVLRNETSGPGFVMKPVPPEKPAQEKPAAQAPAVVPRAATQDGDGGQERAAPSQTSAALTDTVNEALPVMYDYVFQMAAFKDEESVDAVRQRLEGRGLRTRMQRSGKLYVVLVLLRGDESRATEVLRAAESLGLGKPIQRSRKQVLQP